MSGCATAGCHMSGPKAIPDFRTSPDLARRSFHGLLTLKRVSGLSGNNFRRSEYAENQRFPGEYCDCHPDVSHSIAIRVPVRSCFFRYPDYIATDEQNRATFQQDRSDAIFGVRSDCRCARTDAATDGRGLRADDDASQHAM